MLLYYIRHGDPVYDPDSLTPLGKRQAEALAKRLCLHGIDKIFVSTSERAKQTAAPTAEMTKLTPVELEWMQESHAYADLSDYDENGKRYWMEFLPRYRELFNSADIRARGMAWTEAPVFKDTRIPSGIARIRDETDGFLAALGYVHDRENCRFNVVAPNNERVAVFAHEGFGKAFLSAVLDIPYPLYVLHFGMNHSGMSVIEFRNENGICYPEMLQSSGDGHLYREGLPTRHCNRVNI